MNIFCLIRANLLNLKLMKKIKLSKTRLYVWSILLSIVLLVGILKIIPSGGDWISKKEKVKLLTKTTELKTKTLAAEKVNLEKKTAEFNTMAFAFLSKEKQLFPEKIDTAKISRILELYSLQASAIFNSPNFRINSLSFGATQKKKNQKYSSTSCSMSFLGSKQDLETLVEFIQDGQLPTEFEQAKDVENLLDLKAYTYLQNNKLPLATIDSIKFTPDKDTGELNNSISIIFYSQK